MHTSNFKIDWDFVSRLFIGSLFVYAGYTKIINFSDNTAFINAMTGFGNMSSVATAIAIFIEVVVGLIYIYGKFKKDLAIYTLIGFTALATMLFHKDFSSSMAIIQILKNIAIIGGLLATLEALHRRRAEK